MAIRIAAVFRQRNVKRELHLQNRIISWQNRFPDQGTRCGFERLKWAERRTLDALAPDHPQPQCTTPKVLSNLNSLLRTIALTSRG